MVLACQERSNMVAPKIRFASLWRPARFATDVVLIALGLLCGLAAWSLTEDVARYTSFDMHAVSCFGPMLWSEIMPRALTACFYLGWCIGVRWLFGSDFIYCVRRKIN